MSDRTVAFIPVRLSSTRLPRKHLQGIGDRSLISWVIKRLRDCESIEEIVICSPDEPASRDLHSVAAEEDVRLYLHRDNVNDVVGRLTAAAMKYAADICVLVSGDCPLINTATIDKLVGLLKAESADAAHVKAREGVPAIHEGLMVSRRSLWQQAEALSDRPELREHLFPILYLRPELFPGIRTAAMEDDTVYYALQHRISVDTPADLSFMRHLHDYLNDRGQPFDLAHVIDAMLETPALGEINAGVYQKQLHDVSRRALFAVGGNRNLHRVLDLASILVNERGIGVRFVVADEDARVAVEEKAFSVEVKPVSRWGDDPRYDLVLFDMDKGAGIGEPQTQAFLAVEAKVVIVGNEPDAELPGVVYVDLSKDVVAIANDIMALLQ